jgi:G patch domain-containing protein 1
VGNEYGRFAGQQLLTRLGWRPGHGIGPRRLRPARMGDDATDAASEGLFLLAPTDAAVIEYEPKDNLFGLGFHGHHNAPEFAGARPDRAWWVADVGRR